MSELQVTYSADHAELAQRIQHDISQSPLLHTLEYSMLLVITTPATRDDPEVQQRIQQAEREGWLIVPVMIERTELPPALARTAIDFSRGYNARRLVTHLNHVDVTPTVRRRNRLALGVFVLIIIMMFMAAVGGIVSGTVGFPVEEYATEGAAQRTYEDNLIATLVAPTLEGLRPRSTADAMSFPSTVEAVSTRDRGFLIGTATQLPIDVQATRAANEAAATGTVAALTATQEASAGG